ncbi:MAG: nucleotidyltransferase family protein [Acidobacteriaceae bacterium]|nr:nucleotidyltransferase family protein [Acidobacteriaceae bacterium]
MSTACPQIPQVDHRSQKACRANRTAEFTLLLTCCARPAIDGYDLEHVLNTGNLIGFIKLALEHRVVPQVYRFLLAHSEFLTRSELSIVRTTYEDSARRALCLSSELARVVRHLENRGIKAMPYKGPLLAEALYGDVTARQFCDLDILVPPGGVPAAKKALSDLGYKPQISLQLPEERQFIASGYEYAFDGVAGPHALELKWRILPRFYSVDFDIETLFARAEQVNLGGRSFATLCEDDLLLVLCVHAAKHIWVQLSWVCDIAELAGSPKIHWDIVWAAAERLGIRRILAVSVMLAHRLLGSDLPNLLQNWCGQDSLSEILTEQISCRLSEGTSCETESLDYFNFMLRLRERWRDRLRFLWRLVWTPGTGEWSAVRLPENLAFVYHLVRLGRLVCKVFGSRLAACGETPN